MLLLLVMKQNYVKLMLQLKLQLKVLNIAFNAM